MQNTLKNIVLGALFLVPFLAFYVADGSSFDWLNWGTSGLYFPFIAGKNIVFFENLDARFYIIVSKY
jgi:hypothetical protein